MKHRLISILVLSATLLISSLLMTLMAAELAVAQVSLPGGTYTENFDTLASTGTSSATPTGWTFSESGTNANTTYTAGTGSSNTGDTYSFGSAGSSDRALGGLRSGALVPIIGAQFQNQTGSIVGRLAISYNCEQWRIGVTGRGAADLLNFEYSTDATVLTDGTWTAFTALDCPSTVISGTVGALNGNTNRTSVSGTVMGLDIASGSNFWLRWIDFDISGADDGLGIDDFTMQLQTPLAVTTYDLKATASAVPQPLILLLVLVTTIASGAYILRRRSRAA